MNTEVLNIEENRMRLKTPVGELIAWSETDYPSGEASICMRPEDLIPYEDTVNTEAMNVISGTVENVIFMGSMMDIMISSNGVKLRAHIDKSKQYKPGQEIRLAIKPEKVRVMEDTGNEPL